MSHDKKVIAGSLRLVLLKGIGQAVTSAEAPPGDCRRHRGLLRCLNWRPMPSTTETVAGGIFRTAPQGAQ
jgi:hypothetical protein